MSSVKNVIKDNYNMMLLRDYLRSAIKEAGFSHVEISKTPTGTRVVLHVTRPGIVIGRKGTGIRDLTEKLEKDFGLKNPQIAVNEIAQPELTASVMCNRLASLIERGTAFRRATMWSLQQIMNAGAMGVQITVSGKLRGDRSSFEKHSLGILPRAGHQANIIVDEDITHVPTPMGYIGIRIRIAKKDKYIPEFELKGAKEAEREARRLAREEAERKARTESEEVKLIAEKIENLDLLDDVEEKLK
ncbi:MAG: 30S ribosomal protein S3 [Candidatus Nitrosotenuis sp.]|uniref:Small ribosomal subunit protein uS3 n=1 Tax=Candidatus Nitrosotenuis uzonensis TaxID=1407055 RepID=V6ASP1_9ARCH|nr:30S ribosomal protein S3 [Candidatus Nitrosotenuis uzonensis]CAE6499876.1 30S ribosomal protein S3 [Candidatus Nitrosotenuis uzonensis]CDI05560.1 30S ribosomal protein S3P [Candidatus Nitrosotenuis uzonensis]